MLHCVHCKSEIVSSSAKFCSSCGKTLPASGRHKKAPGDKASDAVGIGCGLLILIGVPYLLIQQCSTPPPTEAELKAEAAKVEEDRKQGFHCLSGWDGSSSSLVQQVKRQLRDPNSFEHVETRISPEAGGKHRVMMEYRARNGFGGMNVNIATGTIDHGSCVATLSGGIE